MRSYPAPPSIPNYLVPAVLVTLCCCLPFGIVAVVYAAQVNSKLAAGDIAGAQDASGKAKMWTWIGAGSGVALTIVWILMGVLGGYTQQ
ncbi:MAG TPA: CD225/dispanin family protein [Thermoanaerobaculia bacterium]|nr:CD225/dispanin family protein [Thermoanaerobaculia bacterium]